MNFKDGHLANGYVADVAVWDAAVGTFMRLMELSFFETLPAFEAKSASAYGGISPMAVPAPHTKHGSRTFSSEAKNETG